MTRGVLAALLCGLVLLLFATAVGAGAELPAAPASPALLQGEEEWDAPEPSPQLEDVVVETPGVAVAGVPFTVTVRPLGLLPGESVHLEVRVLRGGEVVGSVLMAEAAAGEMASLEEVVIPDAGLAEIEIQVGDQSRRVQVRALSGLLTVLPPLLAILLAIVFRQVIIALLAGVWLGAFLVAGLHPFTATLRVVDHYLLDALVDRDHASIIIFSLLLGGMVAILSRSGGTQGIVEALRRWAGTRRSTQVITWVLGLFIFFDDYANTLMVGNTMRPVTDRVRVSREKLAYLVDCTAAPIASVALISTWIGIEVSLIGDALRDIGSGLDPYQVFLASIPYRFYPLLAIVFALAVASTGRDFGPMLRAEQRAAAGKVIAAGAVPLADDDATRLAPPDQAPRRWINAVLPIATVILVTLIGLWITGRASLAADGKPLGTMSLGAILSGGHLIRELGFIFAAADSYITLMWGASLGCLMAGALAVGQRILSLGETIEAWLTGLRSMLLAIVILLLAWSIGAVCKDLNTAGYLVSVVSSAIPWALLPALIFIIAGGVSFATGTSWATMGILMPLTVPLAHEMARLNGLDAAHAHVLLLGAISSVLAGATWGDHCSPISDTTILSSMASGADHIDHVRTQIPYALLVGMVAVLVGDLPSALGLSPWISLLAGTVILIAVLRFWGRRVDDEAGLTGAARGRRGTIAAD